MGADDMKFTINNTEAKRMKGAMAMYPMFTNDDGSLGIAPSTAEWLPIGKRKSKGR